MSRLLPTLLIIAAFVFVALFGAALTLPMMHTDHMCPISADCVGTTHIDHWKASFVTILAELVVFISLAIFFLFSFSLDTQPYLRVRFATQARVPLRPPLLQELFSNGILNRKEPAHA